MARVLLTGCDGFAGHYVAEALCRAGHDVVGLSRGRGGKSRNPWLSALYHLDLSDHAAVMDAVGQVRPERAVHLAAISFVAHEDVAEIYRNNLVATRHLLAALSALDRFAGPALIVSSGNIYGADAEGQLAEDAPALPANDYGVSKLACEHLARIYRETVPSVILRPFNYTGVGQSTQFVIPKIVEHARLGIPEIALGNTRIYRDFSDVRYFAEACLRLLDCPTAIGQTVNICSGQAHSLGDVIAMVEDISGHRLRITSQPALVRSNEVTRLWGDPTRLLSLIGPIECPPLSETLRWMLADPGSLAQP